MTDAVLAVAGRIRQLDTRLRSFEPTWSGSWSSTAARAGLSPWAAPADPAAPEATPTEPVPTEPTTDIAISPWRSPASFAATVQAVLGEDDEAATTAADPDLAPAVAGASADVALRNLDAIRPAAPAPTDGRWTVVDPLPGARLTQRFGPTSFRGEPPRTVDGVRHAHFHDGLDLAAPQGTPVRAMAAGEVILAGRVRDGAVVVQVRHADGTVALYGHLQASLDVRVGDRVEAGETIGKVGMTGNTTGPHLHLELATKKGRPLDPAPWIEAGRLPGAKFDPAASPSAASTLDRFDAVASKIPHAAEIRAAAIEAGIDPLLLASMVRAESGFRPTAVSKAGAMGMTQLMPATAKALGVDDPFDPVQNLRGGAKYLASNLRIYGRVDLALAAYQAGKGAVSKAGGIPESPTTHHYLDRILGFWSGYLEASA